uniref:hypothetical protein n=1 Tax=uncultured Muribaculum sp. TaxID=1918613 RepID=UPI0025AEBEBE
RHGNAIVGRYRKRAYQLVKDGSFSFPVIAIVENLDPLDIVKVMSGGGASDIIQRRALDKQLMETVEKYAKPEMSVLTLDNQLLPRKNAFQSSQ